jgi:hypothetical protein
MQVLDETKEANIDMAETKLLTAVQHGELPAIFFFLKCQAKHRGYIEKKELEANVNVRPLPPIEDDGWLG